MTTITSSLINYLVSCNNYCNWQSLIIYVSHPVITYLVRGGWVIDMWWALDT